MPHIQVLSREVAELIAAGEVIDRPSSVIKELLENAIDAGANVITVEIQNGGRTYLRVTDNGCGISGEDIAKAFLRHATSKISTKDDLSGILTLGFRGEALASISAVAKVDVLTKPADELYVTHYIIEGGEEKRLTTEGFNDGPEYSPDGKTIWFISTRSGLMQVWKMNADGSGQQQMTFEDQNNWFGHISPDGKKVVNIAYSRDGLDPHQHLPNMNVSLWLMNPDGSDRRKILDFFGGQGSINVNSWAPDSRRFAFVQYELLHK